MPLYFSATKLDGHLSAGPASVPVFLSFKPRVGLEFGYKALGIDVKGGDRDLREYDVTHYGPIFGLRLHWGQ